MTKQFNVKSFVIITSIIVTLLYSTGCANGRGLDMARALFGYVEPPEAETVMQAMQREYNLCMKVEAKPECVQLAYDKVRVTKGLDPKPIPRGYVVIVQEEFDGKDESSEEPSEEPEPEQ
ncbi:MAG: hypothetical protein HWE27_09950 [Gammaproteobacteria bacterium]|nr:hypothetical protein [Gammaproteobacteria bacterium]